MKLRAMGVILAAGLMGCGEYNREAVEDNNQGVQMMRARRFTDARDRFQRAADEDPKFDQPLYNLARVHMEQHEWPAAADALTRAIGRNPRNPEYHYQLGLAHAAQEHWDAAKTALTQATQVSPNYHPAYFELGRVHERLDDLQAALNAYTTTLQKAPRAYRGYARLGRLYRLVRDYDRANQVLTAGLEVAPVGAFERGSMHNELGNVLLERGQREPAIEQFVAAHQEDPELAVALYNAGATAAEVPNLRQRAILYLQRFIEVRGGNAPREYLDMAQNRLAELQSGGAR